MKRKSFAFIATISLLLAASPLAHASVCEDSMALRADKDARIRDLIKDSQTSQNAKEVGALVLRSIDASPNPTTTRDISLIVPSHQFQIDTNGVDTNSCTFQSIAKVFSARAFLKKNLVTSFNILASGINTGGGESSVHTALNKVLNSGFKINYVYAADAQFKPIYDGFVGADLDPYKGTPKTKWLDNSVVLKNRIPELLLGDDLRKIREKGGLLEVQIRQYKEDPRAEESADRLFDWEMEIIPSRTARSIVSWKDTDKIFKLVQLSLNAGWAVMIGRGHVRTIVGYDATQNTLIVSDTLNTEPIDTKFPDSRWKNRIRKGGLTFYFSAPVDYLPGY